MSEYVIDASALVACLARKDAVGAALRKLIGGSRTHAPYLIDAEAGQALRGLERRATRFTSCSPSGWACRC